MSQMKELYEKVSNDIDLQKKFGEILAAGEKAGLEATEEKLIAFAQEVGFSVNLDEMRQFFKELESKNNGELSDMELDQVAGGKSVIGGVGIAVTVISLGVGCAMVSAIEAAHHADCGRMYQ